jgi:hypothetical protein
MLRADLKSSDIKSPSPEIMLIHLVPFTELTKYDLFSADARFLFDDLTRLEPGFFESDEKDKNFSYYASAVALVAPFVIKIAFNWMSSGR